MGATTWGPRVLTFSGIWTMLLVGFAYVGQYPIGVIAADGSDGPSVVGSVEAPGSVELTLKDDTDYALYLARPAEYEHARLPKLSDLTDPHGGEVLMRRAHGVSTPSTRGGVTASMVGAFSTGVEGTYVLEVHEPAFAPGGTRVLVIPDRTLTSVFGGIFGTIAGLFLSVLLLLVGAALTVGGGIWWVVRRRSVTQPRTPEAGPGARCPKARPSSPGSPSAFDAPGGAPS